MADQGVAVGVQAAGRHRDHHVAGTDPAGAEQLGRPRRRRWSAPATSYSSGSSRPGCSAVSPPISAQPADDAGLGDALDDRRDPLGDDPAGGDVVGHEQRLGAAHDEVVDDHADQVEADRVVHVHRLRDRDLGADAVGGGGEQRPVVALQRGGVEEAGEAAEAADHLGAAGLLDPALHQLDGPVAGLDGDAGGGVGRRRRSALGGSVTGSSASRRARRVGQGLLSDRQRACPAVGDWQRRLEQVLAEQALVGQLDRVDAGRSRRGRGCRVGCVGRLDHALERDVAEASRRRSLAAISSASRPLAISSARVAKSMP